MLIPSAFGSGLKQPPLNQSFKHAHNCNLSLCHHFCSFHELMISILIRVILTFQSHSICIVRYSHALPSNKLSWLTQIQHCSPYFHIYIYVHFPREIPWKSHGFPHRLVFNFTLCCFDGGFPTRTAWPRWRSATTCRASLEWSFQRRGCGGWVMGDGQIHGIPWLLIMSYIELPRSIG